MSRRWLLFLLCLSLPVLLCVRFSRANGVLRVNEAATRFSLRDENPQLLLAIDNGTGVSFSAAIQIELVDTAGNVKASGIPHFKIDRGSQKVPITVPVKISELKWQERDRFLWYRLRYQIQPEAGAGIAPVSGIISLSEITPDLFELRIAGSSVVREGRKYHTTVRAQHPLSSRPAPGVRVEGTLEYDDDTNETRTITARGITNGDGFASLDFKLPTRITDDELCLKVQGVRGTITV